MRARLTASNLIEGGGVVTTWGQRFADAFDSHDGSRLAALLAPTVQWEDIAAGIVFNDPRSLAVFIDEVMVQFSPDYRFALVSEQVNAERYVVEWEQIGTNTGVFQGAPATNKRYRLRGVSVGRFDGDGRIIENRDYYNPAELLQQLGVHPTS
jgi:steroid delta-isomerase-like uncharacterized protein